MAMSGTVLGDAIVAQLMTLVPAGAQVNADQQAQMRVVWENIANLIVAHIKANAVVSPGTFNVGGSAVTGTGVISA